MPSPEGCRRSLWTGLHVLYEQNRPDQLCIFCEALTMQPKVYQLIERCISEGIAHGIYAHNKHLDQPITIPADMQSTLVDAAMVELSEWFTFTDTDLGIPSDS